MKNNFIILLFSIFCVICFHSCDHRVENIVNTLNKDLQFRIDTLLVDDTIFVTEIIHDYLIQNLEQVIADTSVDLLQFGQKDFFVSQYDNQYILADADPDYDPDIKQFYYFIINKKIVYNHLYGNIKILEIIKKKENQ